MIVLLEKLYSVGKLTVGLRELKGRTVGIKPTPFVNDGCVYRSVDKLAEGL